MHECIYERNRVSNLDCTAPSNGEPSREPGSTTEVFRPPTEIYICSTFLQILQTNRSAQVDDIPNFAAARVPSCDIYAILLPSPSPSPPISHRGRLCYLTDAPPPDAPPPLPVPPSAWLTPFYRTAAGEGAGISPNRPMPLPREVPPFSTRGGRQQRLAAVTVAGGGGGRGFTATNIRRLWSSRRARRYG